MNLPSTGGSIVLEVKRLSKTFPGVQALTGVQLEIRAGEVHALMGANGAGKSTLMNILSGAVPSDSGEIRLRGQIVRFRNPQEAIAAGIAMIHQELMPFPDLTVAENLTIGREPTRRVAGWIDRRRQADEARQLLHQFGLAVSPHTRMGDLSVAAMQVVEIAKAVARRADVIIMDEPTSALSAQEVTLLERLVRDLQSRGVAIIYISHKLEEVFSIASRVTVLRDGRYITTVPVESLSRPALIELMAGRALDPHVVGDRTEPGAEVLAVRGLTRRGRFRDISFGARRGEVLGLTGLVGAGRTEVLHALFGLVPADAGDIRVDNQLVTLQRPADAIAAGIALVPEDRKESGLVLPLSVKANLTLGNLTRCCRAGFIRTPTEAAVADEQIRRFGIKVSHREQGVGQLSGGNQQKVVIAKALLTAPQILLLDEPTRGIDIPAKQEVHAVIARLARAGLTVIVVSSELPEIIALSTRLLVLCNGMLKAELNPRTTTQEEILHYAMPA